MPTRRTSPRRSAIRPSVPFDRPSSELIDGDFDDDDGGPGGGGIAGAAPWLAILALVLAAGTIGYLLINRGSAAGGGDATACRTSAWASIPKTGDLPDGWSLGSTDLNANGITVSVTGPDPGDGSNPAVVYASVTCYGDGAPAAIEANRAAASAANATVEPRTGGSDGYDIANASTGSTTTIFRVGGLVAQIAGSGDATREQLDTIAAAMAKAMGDKAAAGKSPNGPDIGAGGSGEPLGSDEIPADSSPPFAPELEALLPTSIGDKTPGASAGATIPLTIDSASASDVFGQDPSSRALAARIRAFGKTLDDLQVAQAFDETGAVDIAILGFRLPGADGAKLEAAILETWLSSTADGVKTSTVTLGGKQVRKVDYGDQQAFEYVYRAGDVIIDIETSDEALATEVLAALK